MQNEHLRGYSDSRDVYIQVHDDLYRFGACEMCRVVRYVVVLGKKRHCFNFLVRRIG